MNNIKLFMKYVSETYNAIYQLEGTGIIDHSSVIKYADKFDQSFNRDQEFKELVARCVDYRKDYFSSDRECAAFTIAYAQYINQDYLIA